MAKVVPLFPALRREVHKSKKDALEADSTLPLASPMVEVDLTFFETGQVQPNRIGRAEDMRRTETESRPLNPTFLAKVIIRLKV